MAFDSRRSGASKLVRATFLVVLCLPLVPVFADSYPDKPIHLIVPFAPGGGNDAVARTVGQKLSVSLGQQIIVDNKPGAGGVLGAELASKSAPDGYTIFLGGVGSQAINPSVRAHLPYDAVKDFEPVSLIASAPMVIAVNPSVPVSSVRELIALAKSKPGQLNYASNGNGSSSHLAAAMFDAMANVDMVHVPYKGLAPALTDLLAGRVQLMFSSVVAIIPLVKSGQLRAIAVTGAKRMAQLPNVPTVAESGVPGYESSSWYGILVPASTPLAMIQKLNAEIVKAVAQPDVQRALANDGAEPVGSTPEEFGAFMTAERTRLSKVIKDANIKIE